MDEPSYSERLNKKSPVHIMDRAKSPRAGRSKRLPPLSLLDPWMVCREPGFSTDLREQLHQLRDRPFIQ